MGTRGSQYGRRVEVAFAERLRDDIRFGDGADLKKAIAKDISRAKRSLAI